MSGRRYRFGPLERRTLVGPLRPGQVAILAAAAAFGLGSLYVTHSLIGLVAALMALGAAAAMIVIPLDGRTPAEWAPVVLRWLLRSPSSREGYRSSAPGAGVRAGSADVYELSLPPALADLDLLSVPYGAEEVGVIRDRRAGTFTAAMAVRGGAFVLRDAGEQERALETWGGVLASCAREGSALRRLQWIERTLPGQGDELASYLQENRDRAIPAESSVVSSYIELIEAAAPVTQEHEVLIVLQIEPRRAGRDLRRLGGGEKGSCELLLREAESLAQGLSTADINVFGLLRPRQYAEVIRDAFDPYGHQSRSRASLGDPGRDGVDPALMGPQADETGWSHYRSDGAFHSTYWVSSLPRSEVGPTFLAPLLMQSAIVRTVGVTIEPVPLAVAMRKAEVATTSEVADEMARARQGFMTTARDRRQQSAASRREEELANGYAEMRFAPFVTVSERTLEGLERAKTDIEHAGQLARLEFQPMYGEQDVGFTNTLPIAWGLR